jgi:hypothetical protein
MDQRQHAGRKRKAAQHGSRPTADIAAEKQPIAATYRDTADALFSPVIVDFEVAVVGVASQCGPLTGCPADTGAVCPESRELPVAAARSGLPARALALAFPPGIAGQSATGQAPYEPGPTPGPFENGVWCHKFDPS